MGAERKTQFVMAAAAGDLIHRVAQPAGPGPHPTVLMLHGRSGDENVMWVFARALPPDWLIVAPRAIQPDPAGGFSAWSLIVLELEGLHIVGIHHFLDTAALFPRFGLPLQRA